MLKKMLTYAALAVLTVGTMGTTVTTASAKEIRWGTSRVGSSGYTQSAGSVAMAT